jgi:hypothetical protein
LLHGPRTRPRGLKNVAIGTRRAGTTAAPEALEEDRDDNFTQYGPARNP